MQEAELSLAPSLSTCELTTGASGASVQGPPTPERLTARQTMDVLLATSFCRGDPDEPVG